MSTRASGDNNNPVQEVRSVLRKENKCAACGIVFSQTLGDYDLHGNYCYLCGAISAYKVDIKGSQEEIKRLLRYNEKEEDEYKLWKLAGRIAKAEGHIKTLSEKLKEAEKRRDVLCKGQREQIREGGVGDTDKNAGDTL